LLDANRGMWVVGEVQHVPYRQRKGALTLAAIVAAVGAAAVGVLPLSVALLLAVLVVVAGGVIRPEEAYAAIEWPLVVLIGAMTSMGAALQKTGAADLLAQQLVGLLAPFGLVAVMAGVALLTMVLTQPMSNAAAALVMIPVALSAADLLGVDARALAVLVTLSASLSFVAPLEPACLLVYAPGKYRFGDFIRAGLPLTILALAVLLVLVPIFWPM
jgi:di/tricarboxylate transporter